MKTLKFLIPFLLLLNKNGKAQVGDPLRITARIENIDTVFDYLIIRAITENNEKRVTIFSYLKDDNFKLMENYKDSSILKKDCTYTFDLQAIVAINTGPNFIMQLKPGGLILNNKRILEKDEVAYKAYNINKTVVYQNCNNRLPGSR